MGICMLFRWMLQFKSSLNWFGMTLKLEEMMIVLYFENMGWFCWIKRLRIGYWLIFFYRKSKILNLWKLIRFIFIEYNNVFIFNIKIFETYWFYLQSYFVINKLIFKNFFTKTNMLIILSKNYSNKVKFWYVKIMSYGLKMNININYDTII